MARRNFSGGWSCQLFFTGVKDGVVKRGAPARPQGADRRVQFANVVGHVRNQLRGGIRKLTTIALSKTGRTTVSTKLVAASC